jgi:hypothetical protein
MMNNKLAPKSLILVVSLLLALATVVAAQEPQAEQNQMEEKEIQGTVVTIADDYVILKTENGDRRLTIDDVSIVPDVALEGDTVYATYRDLDGTWHLTGLSLGEPFNVALDDTQDEDSPQVGQGVTPASSMPEQESDAVASQETEASATRQLPATATNLPLLAFIGALAILVGVAIRFAR